MDTNEEAFEQQTVERLVKDGRTFVKGLRYNLQFVAVPEMVGAV